MNHRTRGARARRHPAPLALALGFGAGIALAITSALPALGAESGDAAGKQAPSGQTQETQTARETPKAQKDTPRFSDHDILTAIAGALGRAPAVPANAIIIGVEDGMVTLKGEVKGWQAKNQALRTARAIRGVRVVNDLISVTAGKRPAEETRADVRKALKSDPAIDEGNIKVEIADGGAVTLQGTVDSWADRLLIEDSVQAVRGVGPIVNTIEVSRPSKVDDATLAERIKKRLNNDAMIDASDLTVSVEDGKAIVSGSVDSAAERAEAIWVSWVDGVVDVDVTGVEVDPMSERVTAKNQSDAEVRDAIKDALLVSPRVEAFNIDVMVTDGRATLEGEVDNLRARRAAERIARRVAGVREVNNLTVVDFDSMPTDAELERQVEEALSRSAVLEPFEVSASVSGGIATLTGVVDSWYEKAEADEIASTIRGVVTVENDLKVNHDNQPMTFDPFVEPRWSADYDWYDYDPVEVARADAEIEEEVNDEMFWSPFVDANEVHVEVNEGVATLRGRVDSWLERDSAAENAFEGGASWVVNELKVE